ncbi:hypothetical protein B0H17DRAFT_1059079, partial [Mycena rosella]
MRMAVNAPPSFRFSTARPAMRLMSMEEASGIRPEDILPGEERFAVEDGTLCRLRREGAADFFFRMPYHPPPTFLDIGVTQPIPFPF